MLGGRECLVLRSLAPAGDAVSVVDEFWVDTGRQSAVLRAAMYSQGALYHDVRVEHQETPYGWLPKRWESAFYRGNDQIESASSLEVKEFSINPVFDASEFDIPLKPGMIVDIRDSKQVRRCQVGPDGMLIDLAQVIQRSPSRWGPWLWIPVASLAVVLFLLPLWHYRRRRRRVGVTQA
jgi:hypothetical protein